MLYRAIYKSAIKDSKITSLSDIIVKSIENNTKDEITGLLVSTSTEFIQVIEGPYDNVNDTLIRIFKDERHDDIKIISFEVIQSRSFNDWTMKGINFKNLHIELQSYLFEKYGTNNVDIKIPIDPHIAYSMLLDISYHFVKTDKI